MTAPQASPDTRSPTRAFVLSLVCPGMGEWYAGQRAIGAALLAAFVAAAIWLLVGSYGAVAELAEKVKRDDPSLAAVPQDPAEAGSIILRLYPAILAEYRLQRENVHHKVAIPLYSIFVLYAISMALAVYFARAFNAEKTGSHLISGPKQV